MPLGNWRGGRNCTKRDIKEIDGFGIGLRKT